MYDAIETAAVAELDEADLVELNREYASLDCEQRIRRLYQEFPVEQVLVTSSFAATSAYFLHVVSRICPQQVIHFIDTGFHFPETLAYRRYLTELFGLKVEDLRAEEWKHGFTQEDRTYERDPEYCCAINKVEPLDAVKPRYRIWMSSLMNWQSDHRAGLPIFEERRGIIKFNPMIDLSRQARDAYIREHGLPLHPLVARGYSSIGCTHCTVAGEGRSGRWAGKPKTECGLHL